MPVLLRGSAPGAEGTGERAQCRQSREPGKLSVLLPAGLPRCRCATYGATPPELTTAVTKPTPKGDTMSAATQKLEIVTADGKTCARQGHSLEDALQAHYKAPSNPCNVSCVAAFVVCIFSDTGAATV